MPVSLPYPVYDADNHLYETEEAMTAHLPRKWRKQFCYVDVGGRKKLAIAGTISEYVPNPTFEVLAAPGAHEKWYRAENQEGQTLRELTGKPIPCPPAYRNGADRLALMDQQGIHAALVFPTLASAVEERMSFDHALMNAVLHSLNEWLHDQWGFHRDERIFSVPFLTLMDVDMAIAELEWVLARGARAVGLRPAPVPGYRGTRSPGDPVFDPFRTQRLPFSMHAEEPIDELAALIGAGRVLFGSDYPHPEGLAEPLSFLDELAGFGPDDQQRIMSDNLKALLAPAQ